MIDKYGEWYLIPKEWAAVTTFSVLTIVTVIMCFIIMDNNGSDPLFVFTLFEILMIIPVSIIIHLSYYGGK